MVLLLGVGRAWDVDTHDREIQISSFKSLNGDGDEGALGRETKDEPAEDDIDFVEESFGEAFR
ncbi:MAG TPA: hypothetical protein DIU37_03780 [Opitutae bacterium]|mgnify:CR=1 FL=1|nr:hypothetical protein [Opitutae bacterium]